MTPMTDADRGLRRGNPEEGSHMTGMTDADLLQLRMDVDTAHREDETTGHTPTGAGLWRRIPALLASLDEARAEAEAARADLDPALAFLEVAG